MNLTEFYTRLAYYVSLYYPEQLDASLKPRDSAGCLPCREIKFDFIIVGAGSAGCVVANRLSANPNWNIALIEAGGDEDYITDTPFLFRRLVNSKYDWNYTTVPQQDACLGSGGICRYPAGYVMGGSSTINGMMYARGNPQDYDDWSALGNTGWSYQDVLPYFLKLENMTISELAADTTYHSTTGPVTVGRGIDDLPIYEDIVKTANAFGIPNTDYNTPNQYGVARTQSALRGPTRCSASKAYLNPIRERPNLYIFKNTLVTKILFRRRTAIGVRCRYNGLEFDLKATKEVIVSAGTLNSPKLLMLSGIGPRSHLEEKNIPVVADLPVGKRLLDHHIVNMQFTVANNTLLCYNDSPEKIIKEYAKYGRGPLTSPAVPVVAFLNDTNSELPNMQYIFMLDVVSFLPDISSKLDFSLISVPIVNIHSKFVGNIKLNTSDIDDPPLIDTNIGNTEEDRAITRKAIKFMQIFTKSHNLAKYELDWKVDDILPMCNFTDLNSDQFLDCFIRYKNVVGLHGVGTNRMGPRNDKFAVVDSNLKVYSVGNLRVVDASVMPKVPRANTCVPTIMVAAKASDSIIKQYSEN